jgi:hypothetical protein
LNEKSFLLKTKKMLKKKRLKKIKKIKKIKKKENNILFANG